MGVHYVTPSTFCKFEAVHHKTIKNRLVPGFCQEFKKRILYLKKISKKSLRK